MLQASKLLHEGSEMGHQQPEYAMWWKIICCSLATLCHCHRCFFLMTTIWNQQKNHIYIYILFTASKSICIYIAMWPPMWNIFWNFQLLFSPCSWTLYVVPSDVKHSHQWPLKVQPAWPLIKHIATNGHSLLDHDFQFTGGWAATMDFICVVATTEAQAQIAP